MPSKRIKHNIVEGKPKTEAPPTIEGIETGEIARERSGMAPDQWNEAIRLQCAMRDAIGRRVNLVEALRFARIVVERWNGHFHDELTGRDYVELQGYFEVLQREFDTTRRLEQESRDAATEAEKKSAGQTK